MRDLAVANARAVAQAQEGEERDAAAAAAAGGGGGVPRRRGEHLGAALRGQVSIACTCSAPPTYFRLQPFICLCDCELPVSELPYIAYSSSSSMQGTAVGL